MLLFANGRRVSDEEIDQPYKAVISFVDDNEEKSITILFGHAEYITEVEFDGSHTNRKNDGLKNFLISLAENDAE